MKWFTDRQPFRRLVRNLVSAEFYAYRLSALRRTTTEGRWRRSRVLRPTSDCVWIEEHHEPYVSLRVWADIQWRLTENGQF